MLLNKEKIFRTIQAHEASIKMFGVKNLAVFSSFVRNEQNENSDIDFFVEFEDGKKNHDNYIDLSPPTTIRNFARLVTEVALDPSEYVRKTIILEKPIWKIVRICPPEI